VSIRGSIINSNKDLHMGVSNRGTLQPRHIITSIYLYQGVSYFSYLCSLNRYLGFILHKSCSVDAVTDTLSHLALKLTEHAL